MKSSAMSIRASLRCGGLACLAAQLFLYSPACAAGQTYRSTDDPWKGDRRQFVQDMLVRWRDDYAKLSVGEIRVTVQEILMELQSPASRYEIETVKKGTIAFEESDGALRCTFEKP